MKESESSNNNVILTRRDSIKKFNIPTYENFDKNLYFNPIFTDDFLFKKAILGKFEEIKSKIESLYGVQQNYGIFPSFYVLLTKNYYTNTLSSILFFYLSNLISLNVFYVYPELDYFKSKNKMEKNINEPSFFDLNIQNLNNKNLLIYYITLFFSFIILSVIQHIVLTFAMKYNSILSYDSIKNLENQFCNDEDENEEKEIIIKNDENQSDKEGFNLIEEYFNKIQQKIKIRFKKDLNLAVKIKAIIHLLCLSIILICITCFIILQNQNIYILFIFDLFITYYRCLIYLHFSENSTTLLRNCSSSFMYITLCISSIFQNYSNLNISYINILFLCFLMVIVLIIFDFILIEHKFSFKGLQKIEFSILKKEKKYLK